MKKVGIITYFYNSTNYGGMLQSFALCRIINKICPNEITAEQIRYDYDSIHIEKKINNKKRFKVALKNILGFFYKKYKKVNDSKKKQAFDFFLKTNIPYSKIVYNYTNIGMANEEYNIFVCGSDQIWNPISMDDNFFLQFVNTDKTKIAYAVSLGADEIDENKLYEMKEKIHNFKAISVREESAKIMMEKIGITGVRTMVDPVFLLDKADWKEICTYKSIPSDKYIFVYILSNNMIIRKKIEKFATRKNLIIMDFSPLQLFKRNYCDCSSEGPVEFVEYISKAQYCCTDSFHCTAFSLIFNRKFVTFSRKNIINVTSNNRIQDLLYKVHLQEHLISEEENMSEIIERPISCRKDLLDQYDEGIDFLRKHILEG